MDVGGPSLALPPSVAQLQPENFEVSSVCYLGRGVENSP